MVSNLAIGTPNSHVPDNSSNCDFILEEGLVGPGVQPGVGILRSLACSAPESQLAASAHLHASTRNAPVAIRNFPTCDNRGNGLDAPVAAEPLSALKIRKGLMLEGTMT